MENLFLAFGLAKVGDGDGSIGVGEEIVSLTNDVRGSTRLRFEKTFHLLIRTIPIAVGYYLMKLSNSNSFSILFLVPLLL